LTFEKIARYSTIKTILVGEWEWVNFQMFPAINVFIITIFIVPRNNKVSKPKKTPRIRRLGQEGWDKADLKKKGQFFGWNIY